MSFVSKIAFRYLFAKKTGVITWISRIGVAGIAIGTAALIIISSVFNGFSSLIEKNLDEGSPSFRIEPKNGESFSVAPSVLDSLSRLSGVELVREVVESFCLARYDGEYCVLPIKGIPGIKGVFLSPDAASVLGYKPQFLGSLELMYPSTNLNFHSKSFRTIKERPASYANTSGITALVPIEKARYLTEAGDNSSTCIEVYCSNAVTKESLCRVMGTSYKVLDRVEQNPGLFKMMRYEKFAIYLILFFIVLVVSVNIYSSLTMLIMEKKPDIFVLKAMGATSTQVKKVFFTEGVIVTALGLFIGVVMGLAVSFLQQRYGIIGLPSNGIVSVYPIKVQLCDVLFTILGVSAIGAVISALSTFK